MEGHCFYSMAVGSNFVIYFVQSLSRISVCLSGGQQCYCCACEYLCNGFAIWSRPWQLQWLLKSRYLFLASYCLSPRSTWKLPRAGGCYYTTVHLVSSLALFLHQLGKASDLASGRTGLSTRSLNIHRLWVTISASKNLGVGSICLDARNLSSLASGCKPHLAGSVMHILGFGLAPLKPAECCKLIGRSW